MTTRILPGLASGLLLLSGCLAPGAGDGGSAKSGDAENLCNPGAFEKFETIAMRKATPYGPAKPVTGIARIVDLPGGMVVTSLSQNEDQRGPALTWQLFDPKTLEPLASPHNIVDGEDYISDRPKVIKTGDQVTWLFTRHRAGVADGTTCAAQTIPTVSLTNKDALRLPLHDTAPAFKRGSCGGADAAWNGELLGMAFASEAGDLAFQHLSNNAIRPSLVNRETSLGGFSAFDGAAIAWNASTSKYVVVFSKETAEGNTELFSTHVTDQGNATTRESPQLSNMGGRSRWARLIHTGDTFGLTWFEVGAGSSVDGLYFRPLDGEGMPTGSVEQIAPAAPGAADMVYYPEGQRFGLTWAETDGGIYFAQLDKNGRMIGSVRELDRKAGQRSTPTISLGLDGSFLVTWADSPRDPLSLARICGRGTGSTTTGASDPGPDTSGSTSSICGSLGGACCPEAAARRCVEGSFCSTYSNTCVEETYL